MAATAGTRAAARARSGFALTTAWTRGLPFASAAGTVSRSRTIAAARTIAGSRTIAATGTLHAATARAGSIAGAAGRSAA